MKYVYGPVHSRRLGLSLGVTLTPHKVCTFNCVYCQLGETTDPSASRKEYLPLQEILAELKRWLETNTPVTEPLDYITLSGAGEPTLNACIGSLILEIKKLTSIPVAVITNASLLSNPDVRKELLAADLLVPSLDAVVPAVFSRIDRPMPGIKVEDIIEGLASLRREFSGRIWLEVMLVKGVNDDLRHIKKLKAVLERVNPDKVQLNSPVRSTAEPGILPVAKAKLRKIQELLGEKAEII